MTQEARNRRTFAALGFLAAIFAGCGSAALEPAALPSAWHGPPAPIASRATAAPAGGPDVPPPCSDDLGPELARLSCDVGRVQLARAVELHPEATEPPAPTRAVLHAVARELARHPEVLLLRIEVWSTAGRSRAAAQERADALLRWLWRREHVSAERLEAVGLDGTADALAQGTSYPVLLRVIARARFPNTAP